MGRHDTPKARPIESCKKCGNAILYEHPFLKHPMKDTLAQDNICGKCLGLRDDKVEECPESFKKATKDALIARRIYGDKAFPKVKFEEPKVKEKESSNKER